MGWYNLQKILQRLRNFLTTRAYGRAYALITTGSAPSEVPNGSGPRSEKSEKLRRVAFLEPSRTFWKVLERLERGFIGART